MMRSVHSNVTDKPAAFFSVVCRYGQWRSSDGLLERIMAIKRVKRSAAVWRELFRRQGSSGLAAAEFCRRERINAGLFRRWRSALSEPRQPERGAGKPKAAAPPAAPFIDLGGLGSSGSRYEVRLELGGGVVLSLARS
jgi:hypothetical protein